MRFVNEFDWKKLSRKNHQTTSSWKKVGKENSKNTKMWKTIRKSHNTVIKCSYFNQQGFIVKFHSQSCPSWSEKWLLKLIFLFPLRTHRSYFSDSVYTSECNHRKSHIKSAIRCLSNYGLAIKELIKRGELARVWNSETNTVRATHDKSCVRFAGRDCIPDAMQRRKFTQHSPLQAAFFNVKTVQFGNNAVV